jgi:LysM repeat protein
MRAALVVASLVAVTVPALQAQAVSGATGAQVSANPATVKHTVKPGDTLWDIAKYYLKDPFKWPEVFHANTDIVKNPHWIYPGQVLTIDAAAVKPEIAAQANSDGLVVAQIQTSAQAPTVFAERQSAVHAQLVDATSLPPALTVRPGEYQAAPYVVDERTARGIGHVIGAVEEPALGLTSDAGYRLFDRIYISIPAGMQLNVGDSVIVANTDQTIVDVGRVIEPTGVLRIDSIASRNRAIASIVKQFGAVVAGEGIAPLGRSFESTTVRPVGGEYPVTAKLLWVQGSPRLPSVQTYVILGAGETKGVHFGDQFTLLNAVEYGDGTMVPITATAVVTIVRVSATTSSAIVVHQNQPEIHTGMASRLTAKMP